MSYQVSFHYDGHLFNVENIPSEQCLMDIKRTSDACVVDTLRKGISIPLQIDTYERLLKEVVRRSKLNQYVSKFDRRLNSISIFSLIKLKRLKNDELNGYLILKNKTKRRQLDPHWIQFSATPPSRSALVS